MKFRPAFAVCTVLLAPGTSASAHRLDEFLQATTISVEQNRVSAQLRQTPGVAVFRKVFTRMDSDGDGVLSQLEQKSYAEQVLHDLSLTINGTRLPLRLVSWKYAKTTELKAGRGDIQLDFIAHAPHLASNRTLVFENHHQSRIAVYLVNCLVPSDPNIQITAQRRDFQQSRYEMDYTQAEVRSGLSSLTTWPVMWSGLGAAALLLLAPFVWLRRRTGAIRVA